MVFEGDMLSVWQTFKSFIIKSHSSSLRKITIIGYHLNVESKFWYKWTYLQNRERLTDLENGFIVTRVEGWERQIDWEFWIDMYTLLYLK